MRKRLDAWTERIRSKPQSTTEAKEIQKTIRRMNARRIFIFSVVTAIFEGGLILFYDIPQIMTDMGDSTQQYLYLFLHAWMLMIALSNILRLRRVRHNLSSKEHERVAYTTVILGMGAMAGIGILDFITIHQMTAYTTILMACAIALLIQPPYNYIVYGIPHIILIVGLLIIGRGEPTLIPAIMNTTMFFVCVVIITTIHYKNQANYIRQNRQLTYLSNYDSLTGLSNRRFFEQSMMEKMSNESKVSCLVLLDIDDFKQVNDRYGHNAGDKVLEYVGQVLASSIREKDLAARWGGEEFILLLKDLTLSECEGVVERMRHDIQSMTVPWEDYMLQVTASFGITMVVANAGNYYEEFFQKADAGLYEAKLRGKNQYVIK